MACVTSRLPPWQQICRRCSPAASALSSSWVGPCADSGRGLLCATSASVSSTVACRVASALPALQGKRAKEPRGPEPEGQ
eukprot:4913618-Pyramimonas_sp.AAC.1